jgi:RNA polymerase sigma-70 factor (ECF subfamily)
MDRHDASKVVTDLFDSGYSSLVRYAFHSCGSVALAEEFTQEAFAALYRNLREGEVIQHPSAWLLKTVRNQLGKHWRRQKQGEQLVPNADFDLLAAAAEPDAALESEPLHLPEYFSLLSRREEEALVLRVEGLRYRQIAEQMGVTTNSVGTLILRAVRKIRTAREKRALRGRAVQV